MIHLWTDASAGKSSGWAFIIQMNSIEIVESGHIESNDINRAELLAVVNGLEKISNSEIDIVVHTDSLFVINAQNRKKKVTPLVLRLKELSKIHRITFTQVLRHERCQTHLRVHRLAREARGQYA